MRKFAFAFLAMFMVFTPSYLVAQDYYCMSFDSLSSLDDYAPLGITFSNAHIWNAPAYPSIYETDDGGARSMPSALCVNGCYNGTGSIYFDEALDVDMITVWALSGPGSDLVSSNMRMEAFDGDGVSLGVAVVSGSLQYEQLIIIASGIRRLDLTCGSLGDCWDDMELYGNPVTGTEESSLGAIKKMHK